MGFSPTTGSGKGSDLVAQALTISSGSNQSSSAGTFLFCMGIGYLLLITGVDLALAEGGAGVIQRHPHALGVLPGAGGLLG